MHGMGTPPKTIGRERQYADDPTGPIICPAMPKKGPVAAIMLDHEESHQESRGWYGERKREPVAKIERRPHQHPERNKWDNCDYDLDDATAVAGLPVGRENLRPGARSAGVAAAEYVGSCLLFNQVTSAGVGCSSVMGSAHLDEDE